MNILIVYAHPEPTSLNGSLNKFMLQHLQQAGHCVQLSDLYKMEWKATLNRDDFSHLAVEQPFDVVNDSKIGWQQSTQSADITLEQDKLRWADTVIFQFPLWWFTMPAILKGWFERVYSYGFAYGVGEHSDQQWGERYGEGNMRGKRAMLVVTAGSWQSHFSPRGINGPIDDVLFPIQHGMLFYPGFSVLPPVVLYQVQKMTKQRYADICLELAGRLDTLTTTEPIAFRLQNGGDYLIPALTLKDHITPQLSGFAAHVKENG